MSSPRSKRFEYELFIEQAIEHYKETVPRRELLAIGDEATRRLAVAGQTKLTELLLVDEVDRIVVDRLRLPTFESWRSQHGVSLEAIPVLIDATGRRVSVKGASARAIIAFATEVSDELITALAVHPALVHDLSPRKFEELIAELLHRSGVDVTLTPATRDGGRDIIAKVHSAIGSFLCYVECKKYSAERPVGVALVRELYGVVARDRVTLGVLVTTSHFTAQARKFSDGVPHQLTLKEYRDLEVWLGRHQADLAAARRNMKEE